METHEWPIYKIIDVARELKAHGSTAASTGEQIAAAFVLNEQKYLPANYTDMVEAWERLYEWQEHVKLIKENYMHLIIEG